jgi:hypothetical protein
MDQRSWERFLPDITWIMIWIDMNIKAVQCVVHIFNLCMTDIGELSGAPYSSVLLQASAP